MTNAADRLLDAIEEKKNPSVVGLDPRVASIPDHIKEEAMNEGFEPFERIHNAMIKFNHAIIDEIVDIVPAVKPQMAFYEQYGHWGVKAMEDTITYARSQGLMVIEDVKRNDIGSTAKAYADGHIGMVERLEGTKTSSYGADMITVNPYLGIDGIKPFIDVCKEFDKGIFVLAKTSNPSSGDLQDRILENGETVYEAVAKLIDEWGEELVGSKGYSSVGAVVGATYPKVGKKLRTIMPRAIILVPGYGAQGGTADDVVPCFNDDGFGAIVNSSRGITFAYQKEPYSKDFGPEQFAEAARAAALDMKDSILDALERANKLPW